VAEIGISLKVRNYKCFGDEAEGFETIRPINIIIGRNNSGKSALLDAVQQACKDGPTFRSEDSRPGTTSTLVISKKVDEAAARVSFPENTSSASVRGGNYWTGAGIHYVGQTLTFEQPNGVPRTGRRVTSCSLNSAGLVTDQNLRTQLETALVTNLEVPLINKIFRRLAAERDVRPESDSTNYEPQPNGQNVTNLIQSYSNLASMDRAVIDAQLLSALNTITAPDYQFASITPRKLQSGAWELFLNESGKGFISLSSSGSGLKTILCALANLVIWPIYERRPLDQYVFGFEELENSLHPALLRRLLLYITKRIREENSWIFLTTHSNVAIDMFAGDPEAQILHTIHRTGEATRVITVSEYLHKRDVLDQLDVRASDLLQSNGIIWVEGPSDRILVNNWIGLMSDQKLREGTHYQCVFYGGRLLAHLSGGEPGESDELVTIFRVNRNAAVVIDSDRRSGSMPINATKERIVGEITAMEGMAWVTAGREIENYIPGSIVARAAGLASSVELAEFQDVSECLEEAAEGSGKRFERSKSEFAVRAAELTTRDLMIGQLDWGAKMNSLCEHIRKWNRIPAEPA
jgi:putative ATP-dependent endonuclease of OLD family